MFVIGLDQSPRGTGYCFGDGNGPPIFGYKEFPQYGNNEALLMVAVRDWLIPICEKYQPRAIATEEFFRGGGFSGDKHMHTLNQQYAVMLAIALTCGERGIDHYEAPLAKWRKCFYETSAAPKGTGDRSDWFKARAKLQAAKRGFLVDRHDVAEAIGIWDWLLRTLSREYRYRRDRDHRHAMQLIAQENGTYQPD